jgi:Zn-dependent protease
MAIITVLEILDIIIMSSLIGFIFANYFSRYNIFRKPKDYVNMYHFGRKFNLSDFLFSASLFAPAIILHELGHKFVALGFGFSATFFSSISLNKLVHGMPFLDFPAILMIIALVAAYFGSPFLFFIPGYVAFSALANPFQQMMIAFSGPAVNLVLWLGSKWLVKAKEIPDKYVPFVLVTGRINMLLFIFNMLPLPGFDGQKVFAGLLSLLFP